jgi:hypothetical protein
MDVMSMVSNLPLDIRLHIAKFLDIDVRILLGVIGKLRVPTELEHLISNISPICRNHSLFNYVNLGDKYTLYHVQIPTGTQAQTYMYYVSHQRSTTNRMLYSSLGNDHAYYLSIVI